MGENQVGSVSKGLFNPSAPPDDAASDCGTEVENIC